MIRVSFSLFLSLSVFCYFTLLLIFMKIIIIIIIILFIYFHENYFYLLMFRNVPACSGMFHVPIFIDARLQVRGGRKISEVQVRVCYFW